jgi:hypothetical protein
MCYAATLHHVGVPLMVPAWGVPVLLRTIPGADGQRDASGLYPVCVLGANSDLAGGLTMLKDAGAVSVVFVTDSLQDLDIAALKQHFGLCSPFKTHYLIDRRKGGPVVSKHHRNEIRRGQKRSTARLVSLADPVWRAHWIKLYAGLVERRGITGLQAFPAATFERLAALPESQLVCFASVSPSDDVLAMQIWLRDGDYAYSHLAATSAEGYTASATYVVYDAAIEHFVDCTVLDLGGGAGNTDSSTNSLAVFKQGFANAQSQALLCGAVLDPGAYTRLSAGRVTDYFPAYRAAA